MQFLKWPRMRLTVGRKLWLGFGVLILLLVVTGLLIDRSMVTIDENLRDITEVEEPESAAAFEMEISLLATGFAVLGYLHDRDPQHLERIGADAENFSRFQQQYHELAEAQGSELEASLADQVDEGYLEFIALANRLIGIEADQTEKMELFLAKLGAIDRILEEQSDAVTNVTDAGGAQKLTAAQEMRTKANSIAKGLGNYVRTHDGQYEDRVQENVDGFLGIMGLYEGLGLSPGERQSATELGRLFDETAALATEVIALDKTKEQGIADFIAVWRGLDLLLQDEIQAVAQTDLAAAEEDAAATISFSRRVIIAMLAGGILFGSGAALLIGRGITGPIRELMRGAEEIGSGNLEHRIQVKSTDETGELAGAFNRMTARRQQAEQALHKAHDELEMRVAERTAELAKANDGLEAEVAERERAEQKARHLAYHDALTGLPNRALFNGRLGQALALAKALVPAQAQRKGAPVGVMFLDLDRFKTVNDTIGHANGDELLRQAGARLNELVRDGDTVARVGGDEFTILLPEAGDEGDITRVAQRIIERFREPWLFGDLEFRITTSIGIAMFPADGEDAETLLRNADTAMYRAKDEGRDGYKLYSPAMNAEIAARLAIEADLRNALETNQFVVHYQPQVSVVSGRVNGVEALVRWQHPERGLVLPDEFIRVAEEIGLIGLLGQWVLRTACAQLKAWQGAGIAPKRVAVNVSPRQLQQGRLTEHVAMVLRETGLDAQCLELEVTEDGAMQDIDRVVSVLHELKRIGVQVALDDFGTGHSSLSHLKRLPIDTLKIDRSFVGGLVVEEEDRFIASSVIALAHAMGCKVVAEGVENAEQLAVLRGHGCDEYQGFLFSKALPAASVEELLTNEEALLRLKAS